MIRPSERSVEVPESPLPEGERVQKVLARAGLGSRRTCDELVAEGHVTVNGVVAEPGSRVDVEHDVIAVDGAVVGVKQGLVHYLLNKPSGVVTTAADPQGRPKVVDLVPDDPRVFSVGRLDADSEGLLLLTNDGDLAQLVAHPSHGVEKEYLAEVKGVPSRGALRRLREGVELDDGMTAPAKVTAVAPSALRIALHEGRNRQVRRMCAAVGHPVLRLVRVRIGPLTDRNLAPGEWRELTQDELRSLERATVVRPRPADKTSKTAKTASKATKSAGKPPKASKPGKPGKASRPGKSAKPPGKPATSARAAKPDHGARSTTAGTPTRSARPTRSAKPATAASRGRAGTAARAAGPTGGASDPRR